MALVQNPPFFYFFIFKQYYPEKMCFIIILGKKSLSNLKKKHVQQVEKFRFFIGISPWFWSKNWPFIHLLFLTNIGQEKVFYDILERKNAFLRNKKKKFKKTKKRDFSKGVSPWFGPKYWPFFLFFIFKQCWPENVFYDILERKNA